MELLKVENLDKSFLSSRRAKLVHAVNQVSFTVNSGEFVALVGERADPEKALWLRLRRDLHLRIPERFF